MNIGWAGVNRGTEPGIRKCNPARTGKGGAYATTVPYDEMRVTIDFRQRYKARRSNGVAGRPLPCPSWT